MIEAYLRAFVNFEQNNWVWLLFMAEFAYNNTKNTIINQMPFEFNYRYHFQVFYKKDLNFSLKSKFAKKLSFKLSNLIIVY